MSATKSTSDLQDAVLALLEQAGIGPTTCEAIMAIVEQGEQNAAERAYDRHQEHLMETGGPTLREQQIAAMKLK